MLTISNLRRSTPTPRRRSITAAAIAAAMTGTTLISGPAGVAGAAALCNDWNLSADSLTIRARDESLGVFDNDGDEPYVATIAARTQVGVKGSTKYWRQGGDREIDDDGKTGEPLNVPDKQGNVAFGNVAPGEVVAVVTLAMENDNLTSSVRPSSRRAFDTLMNKVGPKLASVFESTDNPMTVLTRAAGKLFDRDPANDQAAVDALKAYVDKTPSTLTSELSASLGSVTVDFGDVKKILGDNIIDILTTIADPDGFSGLSVQVYVNSEPLRGLVTNPLVPASVRKEVTDALDGLRTPRVTRPVQGVTIVSGALQDQFRRLTYEWQGGKYGDVGEHVDADGRYEIAHTVVQCPTGKVNPGEMHVNDVTSNGSVRLDTYRSDQWTTGWSHSETFTVGDKSWLYLLKESNGKVDVNNLNADGSISDGPGNKWWSRHWTHSQILNGAFGTSPAVFLYKQRQGEFHVDVLGTPSYGTNVIDWNVGTGWTSVEPYSVGGSTYVVFYNALNGAQQTWKVEQVGKNGVMSLVANNLWEPGWTTVDSFVAGGVTHLYLNNPVTGATKVFNFDAAGRRGAVVQSIQLSVGSAAFDVDGRRLDAYTTEFYTVGSTAYLLRVDRVSGSWSVRKVSSAGAIGAVAQSGRWTPGWSGAQVYTAGGATHLFLMKSGV